MLDLEKWIYVSGIVDGEGFVGITKSQERNGVVPRFRAIVTVTNTNETLINWLLSNFGGRFSVKKRYSKTVKPCFFWIMTGNALYPFLKKIYPYLIVKKRIAELVIKFLEGMISHSQSEEEYIFRNKCYLQSRKINRRGVPATTERENINNDEATVCTASKDAEVAETTTRQPSLPLGKFFVN